MKTDIAEPWYLGRYLMLAGAVVVWALGVYGIVMRQLLVTHLPIRGDAGFCANALFMLGGILLGSRTVLRNRRWTVIDKLIVGFMIVLALGFIVAIMAGRT
jgi:hypothetical protein